jgi:hypothetical protein
MLLKKSLISVRRLSLQLLGSVFASTLLSPSSPLWLD